MFYFKRRPITSVKYLNLENSALVGLWTLEFLFNSTQLKLIRKCARLYRTWIKDTWVYKYCIKKFDKGLSLIYYSQNTFSNFWNNIDIMLKT